MTVAEELERVSAEDMKEAHKRAFRIAFDLLKEAYPPESSAEYWSLVGDRMSETWTECADNPLARELIMSVCNYLQDVSAGMRGLG